MPNLLKTQAEWTQIWKEFCTWLMLWRQQELRNRRYGLSRVVVVEHFDTNRFLSKWTIVGAKRGINCEKDGKLFVKITDETPGAGQARIQVYKDSAQTALVLQGDAADGATATLAEQTNSGLTGTVKLATITSSPINIFLVLDIDEIQKAKFAFEEGNNFAQTSMQALLASLSSYQSSQISSRESAKSNVETHFMQTRLRDFLKSDTGSISELSEGVDSNGDAVVDYPGLLKDLSDAMNDETVAGAQTLLQNTTTVSSATFDLDNVGLGTWALVTKRDNIRNGKLTFKCIRGLAEAVIPEEFDATLVATDGTVIVAGLSLKTKKIWESLYIGVRGTLSRTITDINDGSNQVTTYVVDGETTSNTDQGQLYQELTDVAGTRTLKWFKAAAKAVGDLVAQGSRSGDGVVTMAAMNSSGLTGSAALTFTINDLDIIVKLNMFKKDDLFFVTLTNDEAGLIQTTIRDMWSVYLESGGAPTISEDLLQESQELTVIEES
jgi:hypothetical protein